MAVRKLTAAFCREARAESGKERSVYWDAQLPGFGLMVTERGARSWVLQYRNGQASRRYTINSVLGLEDARREARKLLGEVARGNDPVRERRKVSEGSKNTLRAVCENYLSREGGKIRTAAKRRAILERCVFPALGDRQLEGIKRSDINALLDDIEDNRGAATADMVLFVLRRVCSWHAVRDDTYQPPFVRGMNRRTPDQMKGRDRVLNDDELRAVWKTAEAFPSPWGQFIRFLLLTASRRTEAAEMTWGEIVDGSWTIAAERYKTATEVTLPLSTAAKKVLAELPKIQGCEFVFTTSGRKPISGFSVFKMQLDHASGVKDWRLHDLRRTARSLMSRAGVSPDIAERCMGHAIQGVRGVYDRHQYLEEMQAAFEALARQITAIVK
jgi:integrase